MFGSRSDDGSERKRGGDSKEITDADGEKKYQQILELLLTGGYFRARINGISNFDKILGGLAWAISASNVDVDIDVFQETAALGQKLKIGESVVRSLVKMQCPYPLQTYQIKGLDYVNIFPVVQWLVKKVIETRLDTGDTARRFSEYEYSRVMPMESEKESVRPQQIEFVHELREKYMPQRHFKRHRAVQPTSSRTLLEYGNLKKRGGDTEQAAQDDGDYDVDEYMDDIGDGSRLLEALSVLTCRVMRSSRHQLLMVVLVVARRKAAKKRMNLARVVLCLKRNCSARRLLVPTRLWSASRLSLKLLVLSSLPARKRLALWRLLLLRSRDSPNVFRMLSPSLWLLRHQRISTC